MTVIIGHVVWETGQLPLYTLWWSGTKDTIVSGLLHCTAGDAMIAAAALALPLAVVRFVGWPFFGKRMMPGTILLGMAYTV